MLPLRALAIPSTVLPNPCAQAPERNAMEEGELVQARGMRFIGVACFVFCGAAAVLSRFVARETTAWWVTAMFGGFALMGAVLWRASVVEKHALSPSGIASRTWRGVKKTIAWRDLRSVRYLAYPRSCFRLEADSGTTIPLSVSLVGLDLLARLLLKHAPAGSIDPTTLRVLQATAAGIPPPLKL